MFTKVKMYHHTDSEHEVFLAEKEARINLPNCFGSIPDHLDLQIDDISIHIPLEDLKRLFDNVIQYHQIQHRPSSFFETNTGKRIAIFEGGKGQCPRA